MEYTFKPFHKVMRSHGYRLSESGPNYVYTKERGKISFRRKRNGNYVVRGVANNTEERLSIEMGFIEAQLFSEN